MRMRASRVYSGLYSDARMTPRCSRCVPAPVLFRLSFAQCFCGILGRYSRDWHIGAVCAPVWMSEVFNFRRLCGTLCRTLHSVDFVKHITYATDRYCFDAITVATEYTFDFHCHAIVAECLALVVRFSSTVGSGYVCCGTSASLHPPRTCAPCLQVLCD